MKSYPNPISFRLDETYSKQLQAEAENYGMSPGEYARRLVLDTLEDTERNRVFEEFAAVRRQLGTLQSSSGQSPLREAEQERRFAGLRSEVVALRQEIAELRIDLLVATRALLVGAGQTDEAHADSWTKEHLGPKPS